MLGVIASVGCWAALIPATAGAAGSCPNEQVRIEEPYALALPDCRAYEQVSPVEKNYADALGAVTSVRAAPSGEAVTFNSLGPFPLDGGAGEGSPELFSAYLSTRSSEAWPTQNLEPAVDSGGLGAVLGVSEVLAYSFVLSDNEPPLVGESAAGAIEGRQAVYMRENRTGAYRLLFQAQAGERVSFFLVAVADSDTRVFFESANPLIGGAADGLRDLYEWHEGQLSLVDLLDGGVPSDGGAAGWRGPGAVEEVVELPDHSFGRVSYFSQGAVSEDGSKVYFTDLADGHLYLRESEPGAAGQTFEVSSGPAGWQAATPDGSHALYIEAGVLYSFDAPGAGSGGSAGTADGQSTALTPPGAEVQGVLGVGAEGSYVYFAATGVLAGGAVSGASNIYVWHEGAIALVSSAGEEDDWTAHTLLYDSLVRGGPAEGVRAARVSVDGRTLLFSSRMDVAGYDNHGAGGNCTEHEQPTSCNELYVYNAASENVTCVSCNPRGTPAMHDALLYRLDSDGSIPPPTLYPWDLSRNLSADGSRVFFETEEALLEGDSNSQMDVYEWEREGAGTCAAGTSGGCLYLISSGVSDEASYFAEASANASDVFLFTRQGLVSQDEDELVDLYDAREAGGIAAQNPPAPPVPCLGEACHPAQAPAPVVGLPVSQLFSGAGNSTPAVVPTTVAKPKAEKQKPKSKPCRKGYVKKRGRCVKRVRSERKRKQAANKGRSKR
ncbi:MAG: hypothetical protein WBQ21_02340 [Solirubrobacteraceae bacterium]